MKTDARVKYTKAAIKEVFLGLLQKKPIDKITVTELCERAGINRATFYSHYNDCYDLLRSMEDEFLEQFRNSGAADIWCKPENLSNAIYDTIADHIDMCDVLMFNPKNPRLLIRMMDIVRECSSGRWREIMPELTAAEQEMLFDYVAGGLTAIIYSEFKTKSREEIIGFMVRCISRSLS